MTTWKHVRKTGSPEQLVGCDVASGTMTCLSCGKVFKNRAWYTRHTERCAVVGGNCDGSADDDSRDIAAGSSALEEDANVALVGLANGGMSNEVLVTMMKYVRESEKKHGEHMEIMLKQLDEERNKCKELMTTVKEMIPKIGNFNNNQISVNIFLQERCKDALNLKDFVDSLRIELNDVSKFQDRSMLDAVGNVFVNGLRQLDLYKRPIHCMDKSHEILYIKDNDAWENATRDNPKLSGAISAVAAKQSRVLQEWERLHPGWANNEKLSAEYMRLVRATTCPIERGSACENRIINNIAKEVEVDLKKVSH